MGNSRFSVSQADMATNGRTAGNQPIPGSIDLTRMVSKVPQGGAGVAGMEVASPKGRFYFLERTARDFRQSSPFFKGVLIGSALLLALAAADDLRLRSYISASNDTSADARVISQQLTDLQNLVNAGSSERRVLRRTKADSVAPQGQVRFLANTGKMLLSVQGLSKPEAGTNYFVWYQQAGSDDYAPAGKLPVDSDGNGDVLFQQIPSGISLQALEVTEESTVTPDKPTTPAVLSMM